jgi:meso-butanediol dehydrogenase/(S,S)-butanediol dehydrogenase/diacetyl reductase
MGSSDSGAAGDVAPDRLQDRVALVTGGARGIGLGIVETFLDAGARVMVADLGAGDPAGGDWAYDLANADDLNRVRASADAGRIDTTPVDVTVAESCADAVARTVDRFGGVDILVNNAGVVQSGPIQEFSERDWDRIFAVNAKGIFLMTRAAYEPLCASGSGVVINTASIAGKKGHANMAAYCGSKFAAIGITQSLAQELAPKGVRVNAICPGMVGTAMWLEHLLPANTTDADEKNAAFEEAMSRTIPLGRPQTAEDMGAAALYLATAPNVTGVALTIAGGFEMN